MVGAAAGAAAAGAGWPCLIVSHVTNVMGENTHESAHSRGLSCAHWSSFTTTASSTCFRLLSLVLRQSLLQIRHALQLGLLRWLSANTGSRRRIACHGLPFGLCLLELGGYALIVRLDDVFRDALHAEDLDVEAGSVGKSIVDCRKLLLVDLTHVHR